jgi:hypothetical protein
VRELEDIFPGKARYDMAREINGVFLKGEIPPYAACFTHIRPPRDMPFSAAPEADIIPAGPNDETHHDQAYSHPACCTASRYAGR